MIPKEITLRKWKFQSEYYVTGHFDFEIEVEYEDKSKKSIYRRYSEIRSLYKTLILKCPGCLIPNIPDKSIWFQINYENQEQMNERMEGIRDFLTYLIKHKTLRKNKEVIYFFSQNYKRKNEANSSSSNKDNKNKDKEKDDSDEDDDFDFQSSFDNDKKNGKKNDDNNDIDDEDIEPLKEYVEEYTNKNKGIITKGKKILGNFYNNVKSYISSNNNNNNEGEKDENNNYNLNNTMFKRLNKEDEEFIKKKTKELGEDFDINDYNEKINRLNEGVKNIIENFEKLIVLKNKKIKALENIVNNDKNQLKLIKRKNKEDFDDDDDKNETKIISHKMNIGKMREYYNIQQKYLNKSVNENLNHIKKYQILLQELLDIYTRKKEHINFLGRLHSQKCELEKQKENNNSAPNILQNKLDELKNNINHEIKFIKKINKDLKYEIEQYKNNQEDIYIYINSLFKEKSNTIKSSIEILNKENLDIDKEEEKDDKENKSKDIKGKKPIQEYIDDNEGDDF